MGGNNFNFTFHIADMVRLIGVDGSPLTVHGQARVNVLLHGHSYPIRVVVSPQVLTQKPQAIGKP